ncbi:SDR family NAD(P)-dependent oxidoreductase [Anaerotruncus rubiinfantis]|uniref:SDR family NAD(P)-dependent oxidoreductase n=1 Tax=Anaerotruncus rubiinfantis TaxID=1720200 RepID=UPI00189AFB96|nr:SDR family NAD(P)-dependent oxidoreductase [Anaerotruncus rubiinfantis]
MKYTLENLFGIKDEVIVVSGGTGTIGLELCRGFVSLGAKVGIIGLFPKDCEAAVESLHADYPGADVLALPADVTNEQAVNDAVDQIHAHFGKIDGLVNCAGINIINSLSAITMAEFNKVMDVNFTGIVICCKSVGRYMLKAKKGRVVNISSLSSIQGKSYYTAYAASKAAINGFTRSLSIEWAKKGINVNCICPSLIVTDINRKQLEQNPESFQKRVASIPRGVPGRTEWLVGPVVSLLSPGSVHVTGQAIFVDGGSSAGDTFVLEEKRFAEQDS